MNIRTGLIIFFLLVVSPLSAQPDAAGYAGPSDTFRRQALEEIAKDNRRNFHFVAAKLRTGRDTPLAWRQLDSLLAEPTGDMFWTYPATAFYFYCRDLLSDEWKRKFRRVWKTWTPYRGDTENHFLMYYETLYLTAQEWPDLPGSEWFNGKSSEENFREAEEYLNHWIDETVRYGQTEWDSPRYFYFYMVPLLTLYDFAEDTTMKKRCGMMIEYLLADYAVEYLEGNYCGAHSRDGDGSVIDPRKAEARSYSDFYWEPDLEFILPDLAFAAMSDFRCPAIIRDIARDRETSYSQYERKRSRAKMRYSDERYTDVFKTTYMTKDYAMGSIQGGLQQPIQQHTWDITFAADKPNNTIFALHPYASAYELGMFFPEEPELMEEGILNSKASYGSEEKWIGGSPYEKIYQFENRLFGIYDIPPGTRFPHVDFFLPSFIDRLIPLDSGKWIVETGDLKVGIDIVTDGSVEVLEEQQGRRLRIHGSRIAYVVLIDKKLKADDFSLELDEDGQYVYKGIGGGATYYEEIDWPFSWISDDKTDLIGSMDSQPLFGGLYLWSDYDSGELMIRYKERKRVLDFQADVIREGEQE